MAKNKDTSGSENMTIRKEDVGTLTAPPLDLPNAATVIPDDIGDAEKRSDVLQMAQSWLGPIVPEFIGGALPPLFSAEPSPNDMRVVIWTGHMVIEAENSGLDNDFVQLNFDVLDFRNGKVIGKAGLPLGAVSMRTFGAEIGERKIVEKGKEKTIKTYIVNALPNGDVLAVTYGGEAQAKRGQNAPKLFMFERLVTGEVYKAKMAAARAK